MLIFNGTKCCSSTSTAGVLGPVDGGDCAHVAECVEQVQAKSEEPAHDEVPASCYLGNTNQLKT